MIRFSFFLAYCIILCNTSIFLAGKLIKEKNSLQHELEKDLAVNELKQMKEVMHTIRAKGFQHVKGFYHVSTWQPHWESIIIEQLNLLGGYRKFPSRDSYFRNNKGKIDYSNYEWDPNRRYTSLLEISDELFMNVAILGDDTSNYDAIKSLVDSWKARMQVPASVANKISFQFNRTVPRDWYKFAQPLQRLYAASDHSLSEGEFSTINALHGYCMDKYAHGEKALVYYLHSKGGCCWKDAFSSPVHHNPVADWRELMNTMVVEFPSICLRALSQGYATCGVNYQSAHYSGNFWWADCDHIVKLPPLQDRFDYAAYEFFLWGVTFDERSARLLGGLCGFSAYHSAMNSYQDTCPRSKYLSILQDLVINNQGQQATPLKSFGFPQSSQFVHLCQSWRSRHLNNQNAQGSDVSVSGTIKESQQPSYPRLYKDQMSEILLTLESLFTNKPENIFSSQFYSL